MYHYLCTIFELYSKKSYLELNVKVIVYKLNTSRLLYDILYQNLVTMYIGYLCDSGRFHSMGFLEKLFIQIV